MTQAHRGHHVLLAGALLLAAGPSVAAPQPAEFAWQAPLALPAGASVARVALPGDLLGQLRSRELHDLRVFNAAGEPVTFALLTAAPAMPALRETPAYPAYPLFGAVAGVRPGRAATWVRIGEAGTDSVWVDLVNRTPAPGASRIALPEALFDTRTEKQPLHAIRVQGTLPANTPVQLRAATSTDLAQWTPVPLRGSLFRFDGAQPLANQTLTFESPQVLAGRYLRLQWEPQPGLAVTALAGLVAQDVPQPAPRAALGPPRAAGGGLEWTVPFATPVARLALSASAPNSLVPVRILGRHEAGQPWRLLAQAVVYRLGTADAETTSAPVALGGATPRWLRVEAAPGAALPREPLAAVAEFSSVQLVFLATGVAPFQLVGGREDTPPAQVSVQMLAAAVATPLEQLPLATIGRAEVRPAAPAPAWAAWLPGGLSGHTSGRTLALWGVLAAGVAVLGAVAWRLLRQLQRDAPPVD